MTGRGEEGGEKAAGEAMAVTGSSRSAGRRFLEGGVCGARVAETVGVRFWWARGELDVVVLFGRLLLLLVVVFGFEQLAG